MKQNPEFRLKESELRKVKKPGFKGTALITVGTLLVVGSTAAAGYFYKQLNEVKQTSTQSVSDANQMTVDAVGKLILLPNEQPTIATVTDLSALQGQAFFNNAQVGDKVLIFANAKKAILYNPNENKIVEVAPLNLDEQPAEAVSGDSTEDTTTSSDIRGSTEIPPPENQ
jgi:hypothetical protein